MIYALIPMIAGILLLVLTNDDTVGWILISVGIAIGAILLAAYVLALYVYKRASRRIMRGFDRDFASYRTNFGRKRRI
jgi:hypothetical protein